MKCKYIIPIYVYISDHTSYYTSYTWSFIHDDSLSFYIYIISDVKFIICKIILHILLFMFQHSQFAKMNDIEYYRYDIIYKVI